MYLKKHLILLKFSNILENYGIFFWVHLRKTVSLQAQISFFV